METNGIWLVLLPSLGAAIIIVGLIAYRSLRVATTVRDYTHDRYRQDIEARIAQLSQQLMLSEDRFRSLNHLILDAQQARPVFKRGRTAKSPFLDQLGVEVDVPTDDKLVFVLTPFNPDFEEDYEAIKYTVEDLGFRCTRGDDESQSSSILSHILQQVVQARIVIANITGRNPNVFYELGIAHAIGKPVLIVARTAEEIPFDVSAVRVLIYRDPRQLRERLKQWFARSLAESAA
jgi:nucleoside 2-deoxyribosyltransferase